MSDNYIYPMQLRSIVDFLNYVEQECDLAGIKVKYEPKEIITSYDEKDEGDCRGYFDDESKELVVACKRKINEWFPVFVHEYCHFCQWQDKEPAYVDCSVNGLDPGTLMGQWYANDINIDVEVISESYKTLRDCELNNERRAVECIRLWNLPVDTIDYIKRANIYMYFHMFSLKYRCWYKKEWNLFEDEQLYRCMPDTLDDSNQYDIMPTDFEQRLLQIKKECEHSDG